MGSTDLVVGSPLFTMATLQLENGEELVINAPENSAENVYVQDVRVNGESWDKTSVPHELLADGATVDFEMGPEPSQWGTAPDDAPTSITTGAEPPQPLRDQPGSTNHTAGR